MIIPTEIDLIKEGFKNEEVIDYEITSRTNNLRFISIYDGDYKLKILQQLMCVKVKFYRPVHRPYGYVDVDEKFIWLNVPEL